MKSLIALAIAVPFLTPTVAHAYGLETTRYRCTNYRETERFVPGYYNESGSWVAGRIVQTNHQVPCDMPHSTHVSHGYHQQNNYYPQQYPQQQQQPLIINNQPPAHRGGRCDQLARMGLGAGGGSLLGARAGLELGDGRRGDAVKLGQNVDVLTGKAKEFGQSIKDRYRRDIDDFQTSLNTNILGQAINTGVKAGAFAFFNPAIQKGLGRVRNIASGNQLPTPASANIAGAQAYQPAGMGSNTLLDPSRAIQAPMQGPMPAPAVPLPTPAVATTPTMSIPTPAMNTAVSGTSRVAQPNNFLNMIYGPPPPPSSSNNVSDILYSMIGVQ